jgi:hypothetical protein
METARGPSPVRGLAVALILGVVLAAASVGFLASVPASVQLTGASQEAPQTNTTTVSQNKTAQGGQTSTSVPADSNTTTGSVASLTANSSAPSIVSVNDVFSAIVNPPPAANTNLTTPGAATSNNSSTYILSSQDRSATVATAWRDLFIFAVAGALALTAFLLLRRQMS